MDVWTSSGEQVWNLEVFALRPIPLIWWHLTAKCFRAPNYFKNLLIKQLCHLHHFFLIQTALVKQKFHIADWSVIIQQLFFVFFWLWNHKNSEYFLVKQQVNTRVLFSTLNQLHLPKIWLCFYFKNCIVWDFQAKAIHLNNILTKP